MIKDIPQKIYLQTGEEKPTEYENEWSFTDCAEVTWCKDKIFDSDIKYVLSADVPVEIIKDAIAKLTDEQRLNIFNDYCKHCGCNDTKCRCWDDE